MVSVLSIEYLLLAVIHYLNIVSNDKSHQFNLYYTKHQSHQLSRDCLYYFISDDVTVPQFIPYCAGLSAHETQSTKSPHYHKSFTFEELRKRNISSFHLYNWSTPIDLIEYYQIYLDKNLLVNDLIFYNCTYPWFGTYCEYSFDKIRSRLSFADQVELSFLEKSLTNGYIPENLPCYTHLICDRTGGRHQIPGACLGWREICDGRINCLDNAHDEEHCWQLEINECDPQTEFRCHNGLCIPLSFLNDDIHNHDCLDRSDEYVLESSVSVHSWDVSRAIPFLCHLNPVFNCEEHIRRPEKRFKNTIGSIVECGDGTFADTTTGHCLNGRDMLLLKTTIIAANLSDQCRIAFDCVVGYYLLYSTYDPEYYGDCQFDNQKYVAIVLRKCPSLIKLGPLIDGVVHFVYSNNISKVSEHDITFTGPSPLPFFIEM